MLGVIGKKIGMTRLFTENGTNVPVTIIEAKPQRVLALITKEKNGYTAVKVTSGEKKEKHLSLPQIGEFKKAGVAPGYYTGEFRLDEIKDLEVGSEYNLSIFEGDKKVTVVGTSKGHGFSGTIKRHNFTTGPKTHGSKNYRKPGSIGAHTYPARVFPGKKLYGHYGVDHVTVKNLSIVKIDLERNLLFVEGAVPGGANGKVIVRKQ